MRERSSTVENKNQEKKKVTVVKERTSRMSYMSLYRRIKRIGREAKIPNLTPHVLRHCFGSYLYSTERDISAVAKQLGHKSLQSTQIYVGVINDSVRRQMQKLGQLYEDNGQNL
jgi:site-specific recombinase XerD